jgi:hypothetical protein
MTVPAVLPSLRQGSTPLVPLSALKTSTPSAASSDAGVELAAPGAMSRTRVAPSLPFCARQSSNPASPSLAARKTASPTAVSRIGTEVSGPERMSATCVTLPPS